MDVVSPHDGGIDGAVEPQIRHCFLLGPVRRMGMKDVVVTGEQAASLGWCLKGVARQWRSAFIAGTCRLRDGG